ncbi:LysR substrate-binding domain-containing protein [Cronobacter dublinensis]
MSRNLCESPAFTNIDAAIEGVNAYRLRPHGVIRLNVPRMAATLVLAPVFRRFARAFPDVTLEVAINDGFVDIVGEGFDAGIRLGQSVDQDMTAVRVTPDFKIAILGSPDYFASHPAPKSPQDLHNHLCIGRREIASGALYRWEFEQDGKPMVMQVSGPLVLDTPDLMISAALDGVGLIYSALGAATADHIAAGRLVRVLEEWSPTIPGFFIYFPGSRQISAALRALLSMLKVGN